jgi:hypothetical protein
MTARRQLNFNCRQCSRLDNGRAVAHANAQSFSKLNALAYDKAIALREASVKLHAAPLFRRSIRFSRNLAFRCSVSLTVGLLAISHRAEAKVFRNSYIAFELPDQWDCSREQTEWVCYSSASEKVGKAIIILTAKEVGPADNLNEYEAHLRAARMIANRTGQPVQSRVLKVERRTIANDTWVDGMHESSEVQDFFTRYLATTKDKIAVLVTFSAHKLHYAEFSNDFIRAIDSLRIVATKDQMNGQAGGSAGGIPGGETLGRSGFVGLGDGAEAALDEGNANGGGNSSARNLLGLAVIVLAIGAFLLIRSKRSKK